MWKTIKWLLTTLWGLSLGFAVFTFYNWISGKPLPKLPLFLSYLSANKLALILIFFLLGILALVAFQREILNNLENKVRFYKSTCQLKPSHINPSEAWYDRFFIERPSADRVGDLLVKGDGVVLLGVPLIGKTRFAFEALKRLGGYHVLTLTADKQDISAIKVPRSYLLFKPRLILFLDDLQRYIEKFSLLDLHRHLGKQSHSLTILSTCRSGDEFDAVKNDQYFGPFINHYLEKVYVEELSREEEKALAAHLNRDWSETAYNGTPGSIVFNLEGMLLRLRASSDEVRTIMRSLYLVHEAGIQTYRVGLAERVAEKIYRLMSDRIRFENAWRWLQSGGFLTIERQKAVPTHAVYIESSFCPDYEFGDTARDLDALQEMVLAGAETQEIFDIALRSQIRGDSLCAEAGYRRYLELVPTKSSVHSNLGVLLANQGKAEEAEREYREAIRCDPNYAPAHYNLGLLLDDQGQTQEAEREFREAIRCDYNYAPAHSNLGLLLANEGKAEEAEREYREAIRCDPNYAPAHSNLGLLLANQGQTQEAEWEYREAIRCDPNLAAAHSNLGLLLANLGKAEEAEREFREAIRCDPNLAAAHSNLGLLLANQGQTQEAEREYREAIRCDPNYAPAHYNLGYLLDDQGQTQEAEREYREAKQLMDDAR